SSDLPGPSRPGRGQGGGGAEDAGWNPHRRLRRRACRIAWGHPGRPGPPRRGARRLPRGAGCRSGQPRGPGNEAGRIPRRGRGRGMRRALLLVLAGLLAACNGSKRENIKPPRELEDIEARISVQRLWSRNLGDVGGKPGLSMGVTLDGDRLYAANTRGQLMVLDAGNGAELERLRSGHRFATAPAVGEGVVAVGTLDGTVA